jgi:hopanoid biosynthesis associated protein HpnK
VQLIINADDFGRAREINRAVVQAHQEGVLTSASLMVGGEAAEDAVRLARAHHSLAVGLHVVVVDGPAVLGVDRIPGLVGTDGRFPNTPVRLGLRYALSRSARRQVAAELRAQFERFACTGLPLSHVDGHQHMHMHPVVFDMLLPLAREFGARGVRVVRDDLRLSLAHDSSRLFAKTASAGVFSLLARRCRRRCAGTQLAVAHRTYGFFQSGAMDESYVLNAIRRSSETTAEMYFHPTCGSRLDALGPNPDELSTLLSPALRSAIAKAGMRLSTYADLAAEAPVPPSAVCSVP